MAYPGGYVFHSGQASTPACDVTPGMVLGARFRLETPIGQGGQAVVFQAVDLRRGGAQVVVKVARQDLPDAARLEAAASLCHEARLLRRLRHVALPRLYGMEHTSHRTWLARDLVPGRPLSLLAHQGQQDWRQVQRWLVYLCDLLTYLHTRTPPIVAADLKPANLVLRPDGNLVLIDLGAARILARRPSRTPRLHHGTPGYAPPEQWGGRSFDERADVFALAVIGYELLTGLDPSDAPLQFDFARLQQAAPLLYNGLCSALAFNLDHRCPTAAVLRARLDAPAPPPPLVLKPGVKVSDGNDLYAVFAQDPNLLATTVPDGRLESWLATHPDATLGALRYRLRLARRAAHRRATPLAVLHAALTPPDGSASLQFTPASLDLGTVPIRSWRIWSAPRQLTLYNPTPTPLAWEVICPSRSDAVLRVMVAGRPQRRAAGGIGPGERLSLSIVAMGKAGHSAGVIVLRCGQHQWNIPWTAQALPGVPLAGRHVERLEDLDLRHPAIVPMLEDLLHQDVLVRWLRATQRHDLANQIAAALAHRPDALGRRLLIGRVLHTLAPERFPFLRLEGLNTARARPIIADLDSFIAITLRNLSAPAVPLVCRSLCPWAHVAEAPSMLAANAISRIVLQLRPPEQAVGQRTVTLDLAAGALPLVITLPVQVEPQRWWHRLWRLVKG